MFRSLGIAAFAALILFMSSASLSAIGVEAGLGGTWPKPEGNIGYKGITLDVRSDLGLDKISAFTGRVKLDIPIVPSLYLQAHPMKFEGTGSKNVNFQFGDRVFNANVPFQSSLQLDHYDLTLFYAVPMLKMATNGILNIELGLNARYINFKGEITQPTTGLSESRKQDLALPMGYVGLQVSPIDMISLEGELKGIAYGSNQFVDLIGRAKVKIFKVIFVAGGLKHQRIIIDRDNVKSDLRITGPFVEAGVQF